MKSSPCKLPRLLGVSLVACIASLVGSRLAGQTITASYVGFSSTTGLTLNGSANATTGSTTSDGTVLQLTPASGNLAGSAFTSSKVGVNGFSTAFNFRLASPGGITDGAGLVGADGFTFTLQSVGATALGSGGGDLGYGGIAHSVSVQFDTYQNSDPSSNFIGVHTNGAGSGSPVANGTANVTSSNFDNGNLWTAWIDYNPTASTLEVRVADSSNTRPATANLTLTSFNPTTSTFLNGTTAFVGFTAGTGGGWENQQITNWSFSSSFVAGGISPTMVPEPSTYALLGLGLSALFVAGRRQLKRAR